MKHVTLRPASQADADFVYAVTEASMRGYVEALWGNWLPEATRASFKPERSQIIQFNGTDIGCIEFHVEPSVINIGKLYIYPSYQNRGIGSFLLGQLIERASAGETPIRLRVLRTNPARRFYERHGFTVVETTDERFVMERPATLPRRDVR
jgi:ribosomal protein S18 acetylase RimI-like enzyme